LRGVKLASQHGQHIHSGHGLALRQDGNVVPVHLDLGRFLESDRARLMSGFFQHGSEAKELSVRGFIDPHFLLVFVDGRHPHHGRDHDVGAATRFAHLVNSLTGGKLLDLNLAVQNRGFFVVE
jgi:hypothetical protein